MSAASDLVNQALQIVANNIPPVVGNAPNFDDSPGGKAARVLYGPAIETVMAQFQWDFARQTAPLDLTGNVAPWPWALEYAYPADAVQVWQVFPANDDPFNPIPINFVVANAVVGAAQQRVIHTNLANALVIYNNSPVEATWSPLFREAVVRLLASEFAMALAGKPDAAQAALSSGAAFEAAAEGRRD